MSAEAGTQGVSMQTGPQPVGYLAVVLERLKTQGPPPRANDAAESFKDGAA